MNEKLLKKYKELNSSFESMFSQPDGVLAWFRSAMNLKQYSHMNRLLIAKQMPSATYVAGKKTYASDGVNVLEEAKPITIWAPLVSKWYYDDNGNAKWYNKSTPSKVKKEIDTGKRKLFTKVSDFKKITVYDVSSTDADSDYLAKKVPGTVISNHKWEEIVINRCKDNKVTVSNVYSDNVLNMLEQDASKICFVKKNFNSSEIDFTKKMLVYLLASMLEVEVPCMKATLAALTKQKDINYLKVSTKVLQEADLLVEEISEYF